MLEKIIGRLTDLKQDLLSDGMHTYAGSVNMIITHLREETNRLDAFVRQGRSSAGAVAEEERQIVDDRIKLKFERVPKKQREKEIEELERYMMDYTGMSKKELETLTWDSDSVIGFIIGYFK